MNPSEPDPPLSRTLAAWRVTPKTTPAFRPAVWERIRKHANESWASYVRAHLLGWSVAAAVALIGSGIWGRAVAHAHVQAGREHMVVAYLSALDPRVQAKLHPSTK